MTSRWKQRESKRPSSWRQSLLFNSLLLLLPILAARVVTGAYTSDIATDPFGLQARTETRLQIEQTFRRLAGPPGDERSHWAQRVEQTLQERDFAAARGYLLAAPLMLDRQDSAAVLAAADAEEVGTKDQRLARAALLFLPDQVRASYEKAIAPPQAMPATERGDDTSPAPDDTTASIPAPSTGPSTDPAPGAVLPGIDGVADPALPATTPEPLSDRKPIFVLGDAADLARQSQRWLAGDLVDSSLLRLRALGLLKQREAGPENEAFVNAASVLRSAQRAGRLNERFERYMSARIEEALPEAALGSTLAAAFEPVMTMDERAERVLAAFEDATNREALERLSRDMQIIARLAELTSSTGAVTIIEQASTPEDMRRALLLTEASGERSVALAREMGSDALGLAQVGVKWTRLLILQVMGLTALGMALVWTALSALTVTETFTRFRR